MDNHDTTLPEKLMYVRQLFAILNMQLSYCNITMTADSHSTVRQWGHYKLTKLRQSLFGQDYGDCN